MTLQQYVHTQNSSDNLAPTHFVLPDNIGRGIFRGQSSNTTLYLSYWDMKVSALQETNKETFRLMI
jgi:hypothetical protein